MNKYLLKITGKNPDYFLKKVIERNINIYEIKKEYKTLYILVDKDGYKRIKDIKTSYKVSVEKVYGTAKIREVFNKYFFFILFFLLGILLDIFLSKLTFDIEIVHSNKYLKEIVYNDLKQFGIAKYRFKVSFAKKNQIVESILDKEKDNLEWMEIEESGTKYIVKIEERKKNKEKEACENRNIIAKKNATIVLIKAEEGEVVKKKLDYVLKDEVIISGVIHNKEEVVSNKCAVGQVFGEVWYKVEVELPEKVVEEKTTGESKYLLGVQIFDKEIVLFNKFATYKKKELFSFGTGVLPIRAYYAKYLETTINRQSYSLKNCDEEAIKMAEEKLKVKLGPEDKIITKKVLKKQVKNSKIIVDVFFKVMEDITAYQEIKVDVIEEDGG